MKQNSIREIVSAVSRATGLPREQITGRRRYSNVARARHLVMFLARRAGYSFPAIGRWLCCDHSTVISGVKRVEELLPSDATLREWLDAAQRDLNDAPAIEVHVCSGCQKRDELIARIRELLAAKEVAA